MKKIKVTEILDEYLTARRDWIDSTRSRGSSWEYEMEMKKRLEKCERKLNKFFNSESPKAKRQ